MASDRDFHYGFPSTVDYKPSRRFLSRELHFFFKRPFSPPEQIEVGLIGLKAVMALVKPKSGRSF